MCPIYPQLCAKCGHAEDVVLAVDDRDKPQKCPKCRYIMDRQVALPRYNIVSPLQTEPYRNNGRGRYYGQLAKRMPFGAQDPDAFFTDPNKARDAAKRKADTTPGLTYEPAS